MTRNRWIALILLALFLVAGSTVGRWIFLGWKGGRSITAWEDLGARVHAVTVLPDFIEDQLPKSLKDRFYSPRGINVTREIYAELPSLRGSCRLEEINVGGGSKPGQKIVVDLRNCPRLEKVRVHGKDLHLDLRGSSGVEHLELGVIGAGKIQGWADLSGLRTLDLDGYDGAVPDVAKPDRLERLTLAELPQWLSRCANLRHLSLSSNRLDPPPNLQLLNDLPLESVFLMLRKMKGEGDLSKLPPLKGLTLWVHPESSWIMPPSVDYLGIGLESRGAIKAGPDWAPKELYLSLPYERVLSEAAPLHELLPPSWGPSLKVLSLPLNDHQPTIAIDLARFPNLVDFSCGAGYEITGYQAAVHLTRFTSFLSELDQYQKGDFTRLKYFRFNTYKRIPSEILPSGIEETQLPIDKSQWIYRLGS